jgi:hypothetical protein
MFKMEVDRFGGVGVVEEEKERERRGPRAARGVSREREAHVFWKDFSLSLVYYLRDV